MRKIVICFLVFILISSSIPVFAAQGGQKGASAKAYEHASEESIFNRIEDWITTLGKSNEEKNAILAEREAKRAAARAQKNAEKNKKKTNKKRGMIPKESKERKVSK